MSPELDQELYELCVKYCGKLMQAKSQVSKAELLRRLKLWVPLILNVPCEQESAVAMKLEAFVGRADLTPSI